MHIFAPNEGYCLDINKSGYPQQQNRKVENSINQLLYACLMDMILIIAKLYHRALYRG